MKLITGKLVLTLDSTYVNNAVIMVVKIYFDRFLTQLVNTVSK